jgi:hypothetical protein
MALGVDLSKYQGDDGAHGPAPDWSAIPADLTLVSVKASQGETELDPSFAHNWAGARARAVRWRFANHLPSLAPPDAQIAQLDRALDGFGGLLPGEGIALDIEPDRAAGIPSLSPSFALDLAAAFAGHYQRAAILAYEGFFEPSWRALLAAGHAWWLPWPNAQLGVDGNGRRWFGPDVAAQVTAWQYGQGHVPGIGPLVDLDRAMIPAALDRVAGIVPDPPEVHDMALVRQAPDGSIWSCVTAPDGHPALVDTANEAWYVYGVLGYRSDGTGAGYVPPIDAQPFSEARKLTLAQYLALYPTAPPAGAIAPHVHSLDVAGSTGLPWAPPS